MSKTNLLRMPRSGNGDGPDPTDPSGNAAGMRPTERLIIARSEAVIRQLREGADPITVARRHGVRVRSVNSIIMRHLKEAA